MLNFCSLYSGSSGNSLFVQSQNTNILIDAGESGKKIMNALSSINVSAQSLDAIVVTHEHIDHVKSIGTLSQKYNIPVYATQKTWSAMPVQSSKIDPLLKRTFSSSNNFYIGDLELHPFSIPHDAADPCGFNILNDNNQISIATDLGHITPEILSNLSNSSFILLESNYDPEILKFSKFVPLILYNLRLNFININLIIQSTSRIRRVLWITRLHWYRLIIHGRIQSQPSHHSSINL